MNYKQKSIEVIDDIICLVLKADKYEILANKLMKIMSETWFENQRVAIEEAIDEFINSEGLISEEDKKELMNRLEKRLGVNFAALLEAKMNEIRRETYSKALSDINIEYSFNQISKQVLNWLEQNHSYWIGNYYKEQIAEKIGKDLDEYFKKILLEGMNRQAAGKYLKEMLKDKFEKPEGYRGSILNYFEGFANHVITQTREFAHVDAYERAGIEYIKIHAVLDSRTSLICRELNGRVIKVNKLIEQRNKILNARTPEEAKKYSKWFTTKEILSKIYHKETDELPSGIGLPPYHFHCRTTTVMAYKEEIDRNLLRADNRQQAEDILKAKVNNYEQLDKAEISRLKTMILNSVSESEELKDIIRSAQADVYLLLADDKLQVLFAKQDKHALYDFVKNKIMHKKIEELEKYLTEIENSGGKYLKLKFARGIMKF